MKINFITREDLSKLYPDIKVLETAPETPIRFCFVGSKGVGKTSLLTSMYQQIKSKNINGISIDDHSTARLLNDTHANMLEEIDDTEMNAIVDLKYRGTEGENKYYFLGEQLVKDYNILKSKDYKKFRFHFEFTDMPGGWYDKTIKVEEAKLYEKLLNSTASFLIIDAPPLIISESLCIRNNCMGIITDWYKDEICKRLREQQHTVIMVITRCEKYWNEKEHMIENVKKYYGNLINRLKNHGIEVYLTWIKTLGGVEFSHFEETRLKNGAKQKIPRFIRTGEYAPENCAIPLQLALEHGLARAARGIHIGPLERLGISCRELAKKAAQALAKKLSYTIQQESNVMNYIKL